MVDETLERLYVESRGELNRSIDSAIRVLGTGIMTAFRSLHRISWDAPWTRAKSTKFN